MPSYIADLPIAGLPQHVISATDGCCVHCLRDSSQIELYAKRGCDARSGTPPTREPAAMPSNPYGGFCL